MRDFDKAIGERGDLLRRVSLDPDEEVAFVGFSAKGGTSRSTLWKFEAKRTFLRSLT